MTIVMPSEATVSRAPGLKIAFVAPARYPIREPYAGGLEAFCHTMVKALRMEGHEVHFFAARGSDGNCPEFELPGVDWGASPELATDTGYPAGERVSGRTARSSGCASCWCGAVTTWCTTTR